MMIDCDTCVVRDLACGDCVVTVLLGSAPAVLDGREQAAIAVLAGAGMVPPLRLVSPPPGGPAGVDARGETGVETGVEAGVENGRRPRSA